MIPNTDDALRMLCQRLMTQLLPDLKTEYSQADGMLLGLLMNAIADEVGSGINYRMEDIADMARLLKQGNAFHGTGDLAGQTPTSLNLKDVNALHDQFTRELIKLHETLERISTEEAAELDSEIWRYLETTAGRHTITAMG
jgi:hypothetical protein